MHFIWVSKYIQHESTNWGHNLNVSYWRRNRHFTWSSEPRECLAVYREGQKAVPLFLRYFKTLNIGPAPWIDPTTSRSSVKRSTDWANPAAVKMSQKRDLF